MTDINAIDFDNMEGIIRWIDEHATDEPAEIGVSGSEAVAIFESQGYMKDFVPLHRNIEDSDEYGRWIISQALVNLDEHSSIRGLMTKFTQRWLERFSNDNTQ